MAQPLLIDTDPGCDDALAILLALEHDDLDVVGLTTIFGNSTTEATTRNARSILELLDRTDVPVAEGCSEPFLVPLDTAEHIHGEGGVKGELPAPTSATSPVDAHAAQFIVDVAREYEGELTLATIGRLTNVALALALEPDLPSMLDEVYIMGGSVFTAGNMTPLASANLYGDPHAARKAVEETHPTIVGLDVTQHSTLPAEWIESIPRDTALGESIYQWVTYYSQDVLDRYDIETAAIHDAMAIAALVDDSVLETEPYYVEVGSDAGPAQGALICDARNTQNEPPNGNVALEADVERYRQIVIDAVERTLY